jgi:NitT/TauT family transport system substrate-binding protein
MTSTPNRYALPIVALGSALLVGMACGGASAAPALGPDADQHVNLRLGFYANLTHATALVGVRDGIFSQALGAGVTLTTSVFGAGPDAVTALLSDSVDVSYVGPNPAVNAFIQSHGQAVRVISGATSGGAALVVRPSISSPADLRGRTLATPQLGSTQDVALRYWLAQKGFKTAPDGGGDLAIHPQDNATTLQSFRAGQIDGAWLPEPWASRLVLEGGGRVLVDERDLWSGTGGRFATTLLVVRTDFLHRHPAVVRRLLDGQVAADQLVNSQPVEARKAANDEIARISGRALSDAVLAAAWQNLTFTDDPVAGSVQDSAEHAQKVGLLARVDLAGLFDLSLLNQALAAAGRAQVTSR